MTARRPLADPSTELGPQLAPTESRDPRRLPGSTGAGGNGGLGGVTVEGYSGSVVPMMVPDSAWLENVLDVARPGAGRPRCRGERSSRWSCSTCGRGRRRANQRRPWRSRAVPRGDGRTTPTPVEPRSPNHDDEPSRTVRRPTTLGSWATLVVGMRPLLVLAAARAADSARGAVRACRRGAQKARARIR